ncbi:MAG TPA: S9 family peptidase [Thermoanaerobaculia bacterium]|nr:S9 family peptidase [Thermoanaerobaculia bacterium]
MMQRSFRLTLLPALTLLFCAAVLAQEVMTPEAVTRLRSVSDVAVSPDGQHTAYVLSVPRVPFEEDTGAPWGELHVLGPNGVSRAYIAGEENVSRIAWTPDGQAISFLAKRKNDEQTSLWSIPLGGGEAARVVEHATAIREYAWSPDGKRVAFLASEEEPKEQKDLQKKGFDVEIYEEQWRPVRIWVAERDDPSNKRVLKLAEEGSAKELHWSPVDNRIAITLAPTSLIDDDYMFRRIRIIDVDSSKILASVENPGKIGPIRWSPDGKLLGIISGVDIHDPREGHLMVVPASGGELRDLTPDVPGHVTSIEWRDSDTIAFILDQGVETGVESINVDGGGRATIIPLGEKIWTGLSLSGDVIALRGETPKHPADVFLGRLGGQVARATNSNPWLASFRLAPQEVVEFKARDGLALQGLLIRPLDQKEGQRVPLIMFVHGGPEAHHHNGWLTTYSAPGQTAAARGYAVFHTNYRGSTGRGVEFSKLSQKDPAGKEFDDLVDAVDHLIATGLADRARVGITGGSYGGYATAWGSTYYSERYAAGVMFVGISELVSKIGTSDIPQELYHVHERVWPWEDWALMRERSPLTYVEKARTPLLILHGKDDPRVHPSQSLMLFRYLKILGKTPVRLVFYPGEGHGNRKSAARLDYNLRMLRWFDHYLKGTGGAPPPVEIDYPKFGSGKEEDEEE